MLQPKNSDKQQPSMKLACATRKEQSDALPEPAQLNARSCFGWGRNAVLPMKTPPRLHEEAQATCPGSPIKNSICSRSCSHSSEPRRDSGAALARLIQHLPAGSIHLL